MPTLIVASIAPGAGKTALAAALAAYLSRSGRKVFAGKAWADDPANDLDVAAFKALLPHAATLEPAQVSGASGAAVAQVRQIAARIKAAAAGAAVSVIEGQAGDAQANTALAESLDGLVILVAGVGDDIVQAARAYGARLAGVVVNNMPRYRTHRLETEVVPALQQAGVPYLGAIPEDRRLIAPTLNLVAEHLGADFALLPENGDRLIDNFLIGGLVLDWGPTYFGSQEDVGVIVRGDRPDVQIAALQTDTVRAMVLTKGVRPIEYVSYEAGQRGIPIAVSPYNTHETALKLESLLPKIRFDHPEKLTRMVELVEAGLDLAGIERAIAQPVTR